MHVTPMSGPNGSEDWMTCGIHSSGWKPPMVKLSDLSMVDLTEAVDASGSPFKACKKFIPLFKKYGEQYGMPSILIASIAMQESGCSAKAIGAGGEQGLMQLTADKCKDAPKGNCREPEYNIHTGTKYFATTLKAHDGNVFLTAGGYNGWRSGMTYNDATAARNTTCCRCQNNLDYLQQLFNGWAQNKDPYHSSPRIGKYFNLDVCRSD